MHVPLRHNISRELLIQGVFSENSRRQTTKTNSRKLVSSIICHIVASQLVLVVSNTEDSTVLRQDRITNT